MRVLSDEPVTLPNGQTFFITVDDFCPADDFSCLYLTDDKNRIY